MTASGKGAEVRAGTLRPGRGWAAHPPRAWALEPVGRSQLLLFLSGRQWSQVQGVAFCGSSAWSPSHTGVTSLGCLGVCTLETAAELRGPLRDRRPGWARPCMRAGRGRPP